MIAATDGIVLHHLKYGESSIIATIYTRDFGRQSFIINSVHKKKSKNNAGIFQPLFLVELVAYQKQTREIQRIKEIKNNPVYQNIPFDIIKSTQVIFLSEILYKTLMEEEGSHQLYDFISNSLLYFDLMENNAANFHLFFLYRLTEYLGILPDMTLPGYRGWLDLKKGMVNSFEPAHPHYATPEATKLLSEIAALKIQNLNDFKISSDMRTLILSLLIEYYHLHFQNLGEIQSLKVLKEVFS